MIALIFTCLLLNPLVISAPSSNRNSRPNPSVQVPGFRKRVQPSPLSTQSVIVWTKTDVAVSGVAQVLQTAATKDLSQVDNVHTDLGAVAASLSDQALNKLLSTYATSDIGIEPNYLVELAGWGSYNSQGREANCPSWAKLRAASQTLNPVGNTYTFQNCRGPRIDVWILDTGINVAHPNFEGRARNVANTIDPTQPPDDDHGHGTMVAGVCGARAYGTYSNVNLLGVKCMDKHGVGNVSSLLGAIEVVSQNVRRRNYDRSVSAMVSMSITGPYSVALNDAVTKLVKQRNVPVIVAAGNYAAPAEYFSPASAPDAFTISSTDATDSVAWFSNYGPNVDMFAPGVSVVTTALGSGAATAVASGTSLSTPLVAGIAASFCNCRSYRTAYDLYADMNASATKGVIQNMYPDTDNKFIYNKLMTSGRGGRDDDNDDQNDDYRDDDDNYGRRNNRGNGNH